MYYTKKRRIKKGPIIVLVVIITIIILVIVGINLYKHYTSDEYKLGKAGYDENEIIKALAMGIYAYVIKDVNTELLLYIVKSVYNGAMWLDPKIVPILREKSDKIVPKKQTSRAMFRNTHANLTQREYEVLKLVVDGKSNNDIAKLLCISEHTAKAHVCNIIQKLVVDDRTQAAVKAIKEGLV